MITTLRRLVHVLLQVAFCTTLCVAQSNLDGFAARLHEGPSKQNIPYRLFVPPRYKPSEKYPLILWLHGSDGLGTDNRKQISGFSKPGSHVWTKSENQAQHSAFVVAPQSAGLWDASMALVLETLRELEAEFSIDTTRLYIVGQSMGGIGAWYFIEHNPTLFAAAIPVCGAGDPDYAFQIRQLPIWAFHGARDRNVPVSGSRKMIAAIRQLDGKARYTEYPDMDHFIWKRVFAQRDLVDWLFAQRNPATH